MIIKMKISISKRISEDLEFSVKDLKDNDKKLFDNSSKIITIFQKQFTFQEGNDKKIELNTFKEEITSPIIIENIVIFVGIEKNNVELIVTNDLKVIHSILKSSSKISSHDALRICLICLFKGLNLEKFRYEQIKKFLQILMIIIFTMQFSF